MAAAGVMGRADGSGMGGDVAQGVLDPRPSLVRRRSTRQSLQSADLQLQSPRARPATSTSMRLAPRNANVALQCWALPTSDGAGGGGTQANLLERAVSSISLTAGVADEGEEDGDFLRKVLKSGRLTGLHKACAQGNSNAVVSIVKIDSERHGQLGYPGLSSCDVFGRTALMYAAVADSKQCLDMLLTWGAKREVRDPNGHTAVHYAAYYGKHRALKFMIEAACDWAAKDMYGRSPMHTAINGDSTKCLQVLLKHVSVVGGEVDQTDRENMTPLHVAAHCGKLQHVSLLLKAGANPTAVDIEGKTALHWTVTNPDSSCVLALHQARSAIVNLSDIFSETVLHVASKLGYAHIVDAVCSLVNCNKDVKCRDDQSALHLATIHCQSSCVTALLKHGALDACVDSFGLSPLHYAVQAGDSDIVRNFCQLTSLADLPDSDGRRPLHWSVAEGNADILSILLGHDDMLKHINIEDKAGMTAAHIAIESGSTGCLAELLAYGAAMSRKTLEVESPLFFACEIGQAPCVDQILAAGTNPNIASSDGQPCLHAAILGGHGSVVKCLLARGASANMNDMDGVSALQAAAFHGKFLAVEELLARGAGVDDQGSSGMTPLHLAVSEGHEEVVEVLIREGAFVNARELAETSRTAVDIAEQNNMQACVDILRQCGGLNMDEVRDLAATAIQAVIRGYLARKNTKWVGARKRAAIVMQKTARGFLQRRRYALTVRQEKAATLIQSQWRGYAERCRLHQRLIELKGQEHHSRVVQAVHARLVRQWTREGLRRSPPKAKPPVLTRKQMLRNPPKPAVPPAYDLGLAKSVTNMLQSESESEREERMALERRQRLEMALRMRERHAEKARQVREFHERERKRKDDKEGEKERQHYSTIVQESVKRHQQGRALLQHSYTVRSAVSAAIAVQRCFRLWRDKAAQRPAAEQARRRRCEEDDNAAEVIQQTWRHFRGMKKVKEARRLLTEYRTNAILRGTEADMDVARHQRPTLQTRYQSRKLLTASPVETPSARSATGAIPIAPATGPPPVLPHQRSAQMELEHQLSKLGNQRKSPGASVSRAMTRPVNLRTSKNSAGATVSPRAHVHALPVRSTSDARGRASNSRNLDLSSGIVGEMTRTSLRATRSQFSKPAEALERTQSNVAGKVVVPMAAVNARRWSIPTLPVLPEISKKAT